MSIRFTLLLIPAMLGMWSPPSQASDICTEGDISLLVNRPANAVSPCTVNPKNLLIESGYERREMMSDANTNVYPITQLRLGLPKDTEIYSYLPIYIDNPVAPFSGNTSAIVGAKHKILGNEKVVLSIDGLLIFPGGSYEYGSRNFGEHLNGIISYAFNKQWNLIFMFTVYNQAQPESQPNQYFSGVGPDLAISYAFTENMSVYAEIFGQSRVSPILGSGYNVDGGLVFTITPNITLDIEYSNRLSGELGDLTHYIGAGGSIRL